MLRRVIITYFLILLITCLWLLLCNISLAKSHPLPPRGIYSFGWGLNFIDTKSLELSYISGMTAYFGWNDLEPEPHKYNFTAIDALLALARKWNKKINIGFYPGANAPLWIYDKGAQSFSWKNRLPEEQARRRGWNWYMEKKSPLPWDPVFLTYWKKLLVEFSKRYSNNQNIGYIAITGPVIDETATGILLKDDNDFERFMKLGYTEDKLIGAWKGIIDHYEVIFPNNRLVLALAPMRPGKPDVSRARMLMQYIIENNYKNISFLCVVLNDTWFIMEGNAANRIRQLLKEADSKGFSFGYQMAQSAHRNATWKKDPPIVRSLRDSLKYGIKDGALWIEVWHPDIIDPANESMGRFNPRYVDDLKWATEQMMRN